MGILPHSYQIHVRIEKSKKLLSNRISIANTAFQMGFADQSHYIKFFKRIVGITPGKFIKYNFKVKSSV